MTEQLRKEQVDLDDDDTTAGGRSGAGVDRRSSPNKATRVEIRCRAKQQAAASHGAELSGGGLVCQLAG